jgi:hypothetical protein
MTDTNAPLPGRPGGTSRPRDRAGILRRALDRIAPGRASRRFETLVQELSDAVWEMDPALTRIVFVSDRLTDLVRRSPAEMQRDRSMWMRDVVHPADHQAFADFMVRVRTVARPRSSIGRSAPPRRASSARRRCQPATGCATPSPAGAGSRTRRSSSTGTTASRSTARACLRDVTAEELATRAQGEAEQRFRTMVEHHLDLVLAGRRTTARQRPCSTSTSTRSSTSTAGSATTRMTSC